MMTFQVLREGLPARAGLDEIQKKIQTAAQELEAVTRAPVTKAEVRAGLKKMAEMAVYRLAPESDFDHVRQLGMIPRLPELNFGHIVYLLGEEELVDRIMARMEPAGTFGKLPLHERQARTDVLRAELDKLERAEETEVLQLEAAGHLVLRRENVRPELLLQVWGERKVA